MIARAVCQAAIKVAPTQLLLHADDFGFSRAVTDGILRGFSDGLLTSTSLMANAPAASEALEAWSPLQARQAHGELPSASARQRLGDGGLPFDLGIHLNLTQGYPLTASRYPEELRLDDGRFCGIGQAFMKLGCRPNRFTALIRDELSQQIEFMLDHGHAPTHLNGHQYVELLPGVADLVPQLLEVYQIPVVRVAREPLRWPPVGELASWGLGRIKWLFALAFRRRMRRAKISHPGACFGTCHAGRIGLDQMHQFLSGHRLPAIVEIVLHPGSFVASVENADRTAWFDPLADGRPRELELLKSQELLRLIESCGGMLTRLSEIVTTSANRSRLNAA